MAEKIYKFHVQGMHCKSCVILTENELLALPVVSKAKARLDQCCVEVTGDFGDQTAEEIARELSIGLERHGYALSPEAILRTVKWSEFRMAILITALFVALYVFLQKIGLVNLVSVSEVSYGTAFVIGIIASLSTCMAVVGGLVLSVSASFAKEGDKTRPQIFFHIGRLVAFFALGGAIGALGSAFQLGAVGTFVLSLIIGLVMLILGVNLLDVFPWAKKLQPSMPKFISKHALGISKLNHTLTPMLVGVATFFLPCGFTQSMQIYTLSTGTFLQGALTMSAFALGTLPVLALLSFSSLSIHQNKNKGIFFKTAGLIVILFALFNIINSLVIIGVIPPIFNF
ncbi:MAG TPA: sulfite exporter TauE/SafE family protein [Candidatus Paceibacterota bacterium]